MSDKLDTVRLASLIDGLMRSCRRGAIHGADGPMADEEQRWRTNLEQHFAQQTKELEQLKVQLADSDSGVERRLAAKP